MKNTLLNGAESKGDGRVFSVPKMVPYVFLVWCLAVYYNLAALSGSWTLAVLSLTASAALTHYYMLARANMLEATFYLASLHLVLPMISHPTDILPINDLMLDDGWIMPSDRIQARTIITSFASIAYIYKYFHISISNKKISTLATIASLIFLTNILSFADYISLSKYQAVVDGIYFSSVICCAFYFRSIRGVWAKESLKIGYASTHATFLLLAGILCFDIAVSISGVVSWTSSYRDGLQGLFYGFELPFALIIGLTATYFGNFNSKNYILLLLFIFAAGGVLWQTNIRSAVGGFFIACLMPLLLRRRLTRGATKLFLLGTLFSGYFLLSMIEGDSSLLVRLGTYASYGLSFVKQQAWIFGMQPGIVDFTMLSNLAASHFSSDYEAQLVFLADNVVGELRERATYDEGGAFLPHNAWLCIIFSYGVLSIPMLFYYVIAPARYIFASTCKNHIVYGDPIFRLIIYICIFACLHPIIILFNLICLVELLQGKALVFQRSRSARL